MSAARYSTCIAQGSTFTRELTYTDSTGSPVNLTDAEIRMQVRATVSNQTVLVDLSTATSGITIVDALAGSFRIQINAATTSAYTWKKGVYDLEVEFPTGEVRRIMEGIIEVSPEVTR